MNKFKYLITFMLMIFVFQFAHAEKRAKPLPMKELTDPSSHNYVPYPYPKTENEIIADMKYAIKKIFIPSEDRYEVLLGPTPSFRKILPNLLKKKSDYKIGKIIKVKNIYSGHAFDYFWLIIILNKDDSKAACVIIDANGLYGGTSSGFPKDKPIYLKTDDDILNDLSVTLDRFITKKDIKYMQAIELPPYIGSLFNPAYEIKLKNGEIYYFSSNRNGFYKVKQEYPWKKNKKGIRPDIREFVPYPEIYSYDQIEDKIMVFEKIQKK